MKTLPALALNNTAEQIYRTWCVKLAEGVTIDDVFNPLFYVHAKILQKDDLMRVIAFDGSFDFMVKCVAKEAGVVIMERWPKLPQAAGVPGVRTNDAINAVLGQKTDEEHLQEALVDHVADKAADNLGAPNEKGGKPVPRVEFTNVTKWRVIGFDGLVVSQGHETEALAKAALEKVTGRLATAAPKRGRNKAA